MKTIRNYLWLLLLYLTISGGLFAQAQKTLIPQPGKIFIDKAMHDLEVLSDSVVVLNSGSDRHYIIKNDTVYIRRKHWEKNRNTYQPVYEVLNANIDTIRLKNINRDSSISIDFSHDTLVFVNLEKLKQPINQFKHVKLKFYSSFGGGATVSVDSTGQVGYLKSPEVTDDKGNSLSLITGYFSADEFERFKDVLSKSLIMNLPESRLCDQIDVVTMI